MYIGMKPHYVSQNSNPIDHFLSESKTSVETIRDFNWKPIKTLNFIIIS